MQGSAPLIVCAIYDVISGAFVVIRSAFVVICCSFATICGAYVLACSDIPLINSAAMGRARFMFYPWFCHVGDQIQTSSQPNVESSNL